MQRKRFLSCLAAAVIAAAAAAAAQEPPPGPDRLLSSIVGISAKVPADARTAGSLGTERDGSGAVIDDDGLVVTVGYLILEASSATIETAGGATLPAEILAYDHDTGFGLLRARGDIGARPLPLGSSGGLEEGEPVLAASHGGRDGVLPAFVVDRREFAGYWEYLLDDAIFTAPPHARFGGAALVDRGGRLVGIGSLIVPNAMEREDAVVPGNMFIPIDALKPILGDLLVRGRSARGGRPWLGLHSEAVRGRLFVASVPRSGPAWRAGIRPGDMVLGVAGAPVQGLADFYRKVWALGGPGVAVPLQVLRGSTPRTLEVRSADRRDWLKLRPGH